MPQSAMTGTRIRERRLLAGMRQSDLARSAGISPSYLNLIEHNKRRIGGKTLIKIADALQVEAALLSEGAEAALVAGLREAAGAHNDDPPELDRIDEFASRFPGWARLVSSLKGQCATLEQTVETLTDRLAHDPDLATSLHEVITAVTAIHSTSSILTETKELEPEWQSRFHRNINEDSARLVQSAESLVRYLEETPDIKADIRSPQDELHAFLGSNDFHFPQLERSADDHEIDQIINKSAALNSASAKSLARVHLRQYLLDAAQLPLHLVITEVGQHGIQPARMAQVFDVGFATLFRRLAAMPGALVGPVGLVICDGTGTIIVRKPIMGFSMLQRAGGCALWPLYQVLAQPGQPLRRRLRQLGREPVMVQGLAIAETRPAGFDSPLLVRPHMLILPDDGAALATPVLDVGVSCRICPISDCTARREPSIMADGF